jgi:hypothetical protein
MISPKLRWSAIPLSFVGGLIGATWLYFEVALACFHFGSRPASLCSDWWYANHGAVAIAASAVCLLAFSVAVPAFLAPSHKRSVTLLALLATLGFIFVNFESPVRWRLMLACVVAGASALVVPGLLRNRGHAA